jgi:periplasmic protein TonB
MKTWLVNHTDRTTLLIVTVVASLHLMVLNPSRFMHKTSQDKEEVDIVVELAPNRPSTTAPPPSAAPPTPTRTPAVQPHPRTTDDHAQTNEPPQPPPANPITNASPQAPIGESTGLPTTNAAYEVGSAKNPRPPYPPVAFLSRTEGRVVLKVQVKSDGKPGDIQLLQSSGSQMLDKSALDTIAQWELQPARKNGQAVDQWIEIPIHFRLLKK